MPKNTFFNLSAKNSATNKNPTLILSL